MKRELGVSERRACEVIGQPRSTQRYESTKHSKEKALVKRIYELSAKEPRYGYRRIAVLLRREGWKVNTKRVQRLRRQEGLQVKRRKTRKRRSGSSENACDRRRAERRNHVWSYDFVADGSEDGKRLKLLTIIDEFTRESLSIRVARSITADDVMEELAVLFEERGAPEYVRSDNGPEFVADAIRAFLRFRGAQTLYIAPGSPWENGYIESFNATLRDELLDRELFANLLEAQVVTEQYRRKYNEFRPHGALGYETPTAFAEALETPPIKLTEALA